MSNIEEDLTYTWKIYREAMNDKFTAKVREDFDHEIDLLAYTYELRPYIEYRAIRKWQERTGRLNAEPLKRKPAPWDRKSATRAGLSLEDAWDTHEQRMIDMYAAGVREDHNEVETLRGRLDRIEQVIEILAVKEYLEQQQPPPR